MSAATLTLIREVAAQIKVPRRRSLLEFAEQEIVIPTGPHKGRFKRHTQPIIGLYLAEIDRGGWSRFAFTFTTQGGKTTGGYVIQTVYHLFEHGETVVLGVPDMNMANDKWQLDLLPVIKAGRYHDLLPRHGPGSRDGQIKDSVTFENGAVLKFMTGGGGDAKRAGFTTRVVAGTEVDKMDEPGGASDETDKVSQIEARTDSYGNAARVFLECTVTVEQGRIWREVTNGSNTRVACPCPHCRAWVTPEREHLTGWREAETEEDARDAARWHCPDCGAVLTEAERAEMNRAAVLVHKGQEVAPDGAVVGPRPRTRTLGLRGNAFNNLFWTAETVAAREWRAARRADEEHGEKELLQYVWVKPYVPPVEDLSQVTVERVMGRTFLDRDGQRPAEPHGHVPADADVTTVGVDLGKRLGHWAATAFRADSSPHVLDYGRFEIASDDLGDERAMLAALREFRDGTCEVGWQGDDGPVKPALVLIDAGWAGPKGGLDEIVHAFCRESNALAGTQRYLSAKGFGATKYVHPLKLDKRVREIGEQYHIARIERPQRALLVNFNADYWKSRVHSRLMTPPGQPGAMTLYRAEQRHQHLSFAKHATAERQVSEFVPERGTVVRWVRVHGNNHWLDAATLANVAGHRAGVRVVPVAPPAPVSPAGWFASQRRR